MKSERWQGPPHANKAKQYEIVLSFKFSWFIPSLKIFLIRLNSLLQNYAVHL